MAGPPSGEIPPQTGLPKVDRKVTRDLLFGKNKEKPQDLMTDFFIRYPHIDRAIMEGFTLPAERVINIWIGAGNAGILLLESQKRNGGQIPRDISQDAIDAAIQSIKDQENRGVGRQYERLLDADAELFLATTILAGMMKVEPSDLVQGAMLLVDIFTHKLAGDKLEEELGL